LKISVKVLFLAQSCLFKYERKAGNIRVCKVGSGISVYDGLKIHLSLKSHLPTEVASTQAGEYTEEIP
jgi:hypothetical protein